MAHRERVREPVTTRIPLHAAIFDMGGTLEDVYYDDAMRLKATYGFRDLLAKHDLDPGLEIPELYALVKTGMKNYQSWRLESQQELAPEQLWSNFVFTNHTLPQDKLAAAGEELAFYWDTRFFRRALRPEVPAMLDALRTRGFRLGVISNITSRGAVPHSLAEYELAHYFQVVLMSAASGWRKPNLRIFLEAARQLDLPPAACAYTGDTVSRDVIGARRAGYGLVIQIKSFLTTVSDGEKDVESPDAVVENLMQVVDLIGD
jgi:putative hydrolase of the HAD superfamily